MRQIFVDEAGTSKHEPILVVAGVIIDPDKQWMTLDARIEGLLEKYIPEADRDGFVFHATELFSGGKYFQREQWSREVRWQILQALLAIIPEFELPVPYGMIEKSKFLDGIPAPPPEIADQVIPDAMHATALGYCAIAAENWMRHSTRDEVAMFIAEDIHDKRPILKHSIRSLRTKKELEKFGQTGNPHLPLTRVIETLYFARKEETALLQLADAAAFVIKRKLQGAPEADRFFNIIKPGLVYFMAAAETK